MMLQQTSEVARLREQNEMLLEENRQLRETLVPAMTFPLEWGLRPVHCRILSCLLSAKNGVRTKNQLSVAACREDTLWDQTLKVHVSTLRRQLRGTGVEIAVRYGVGYELPPASRAILEAAMERAA
jgi:DNA-binding response OmpR family regulator